MLCVHLGQSGANGSCVDAELRRVVKIKALLHFIKIEILDMNIVLFIVYL